MGLQSFILSILTLGTLSAEAGVCKQISGKLKVVDSKQVKVETNTGKSKVIESANLDKETLKFLSKKVGEQVSICNPIPSNRSPASLPPSN